MGSSVGTRMVAGKVDGTGAAINISLPFTPKKVELYNVDGDCFGVWTDTMAAASMQKTVTSGAGTTDISFVTTGGVTAIEQLELDDGASPGRGFTIGADTDVNVSAEVIHYVAYE